MSKIAKVLPVIALVGYSVSSLAATISLGSQNWQSDPLPAIGGDNVLYGHGFSVRGNPMGGKIDGGIFEVRATDGTILQTLNTGATGGRAVAQIGSYIYYGGDDAQGLYVTNDDADWSDNSSALTVGNVEAVATDGTFIYTNDDGARNTIRKYTVNGGDGSLTASTSVTLTESRVRGISYYNGWVFTSTMEDGFGNMWAWDGTDGGGSHNLGTAPPNTSIGGRDMNITTAGVINGNEYLMATDLENLYIWDLDTTGASPVISNLETITKATLAANYAGIFGSGVIGSIWIDDANDQIILGGGGDSAAMTAIAVIPEPATLALLVLQGLAIGLGGLTLRRRRRRA